MKMLFWEGGVYLDEGERLKREDKLRYFYDFPHGVTLAVPLLLSAFFPLCIAPSHTAASPLPRG